MNIYHENRVKTPPDLGERVKDLINRVKDLENKSSRLKSDLSNQIFHKHSVIEKNLTISEDEVYIVYGFLRFDVLFNKNILLVL